MSHRSRDITELPFAAAGNWSRRAFVIGGGSTLLATTAFAKTESKGRVVLGQVALSFYAVTGAVIHEVLERLGHTVELRTGPHESMFPLLGSGEIDLMAAAWLPEGHGSYWARFGSNAEEVARLYDGASFFWAVPSYVPEADVRSIADLAKPAIAERVVKTIQSVGAGATITTVSDTAVTDYGLRDLGFTLRPGTAVEWIQAYKSAIADKNWIVFPTWAPQFLNKDGGLRRIEDPRKILGGTNHAAIVAPRDRFARLPEKTRSVLKRIKLSIPAVTEMDWSVNVDGKSPREAASVWIGANEQQVASWFDV